MELALTDTPLHEAIYTGKTEYYEGKVTQGHLYLSSDEHGYYPIEVLHCPWCGKKVEYET